jgi:hypothetical protein
MSWSGKTRFAAWLLSLMPISTMPWIIIDYKGDDLINAIRGAKYITPDDPLPEKPGIYILKAESDEDEALSDFFFRVKNKGGIGLFVDEGLMLGTRNKGFVSCLTQGRSLHIPIIILSQRPVWVTKFARTEATFIVLFELQDVDDRNAVRKFMKGDTKEELPRFHSYYYDSKDKMLSRMGPVPDDKTILAAIERKIPRERRTL